MTRDPVHGSTIQWTYEAGAMAGKTFEHAFSHNGKITYRMLGSNSDTPTEAKHSEIAKVSEDVWAISYLGSAGYTLTVVLDFKTNKLVSFASNETQLSQQKGTFEVVSNGGQAQAKQNGKAEHNQHRR
ncbi:MAG TPA: MoaF N-terminal domain-containing protein [Polyangiales bacterium]|nr:MoaF N-terminal domain-containing protein [Polyangiales bacterium]